MELTEPVDMTAGEPPAKKDGGLGGGEVDAELKPRYARELSETMTATRPTWAEISREKLLHNYRVLRRLVGPETELLAVVKANSYGQGMETCARILAADGAGWFGVTCVEEAVALRAVCPAVRILVFSGVWPGEAEAVVDHRLTPVVWEAAHFDLLEDAARRRGMSAGELPVHLEIDTGMSRQGVQNNRLGSLLSRFEGKSPLRLEAVMTHFHSPDEREPTESQARELATAMETVARAGLHSELLSAGSSVDVVGQSTLGVTALARRYGARRMVRPGIALYGYASPQGAGAELEPVLSWKANVTSVREIEPGTKVGYGGTFTARRRMRLALLPVGYADGFNRLLSNKGWVLIRGKRAPVAGRVSMDQTTVDVTDIAGVAAGDEVVIIGTQGSERLTATDLAELTGTIPYEVLCEIAARVPRKLVS